MDLWIHTFETCSVLKYYLCTWIHVNKNKAMGEYNEGVYKNTWSYVRFPNFFSKNWARSERIGSLWSVTNCCLHIWSHTETNTHTHREDTCIYIHVYVISCIFCLCSKYSIMTTCSEDDVVYTYCVHGIHKASMSPIAVMYCYKWYPCPANITILS